MVCWYGTCHSFGSSEVFVRSTRLVEPWVVEGSLSSLQMSVFDFTGPQCTFMIT